jgi:hypothetical protein
MPIGHAGSLATPFKLTLVGATGPQSLLKFELLFAKRRNRRKTVTGSNEYEAYDQQMKSSLN